MQQDLCECIVARVQLCMSQTALVFRLYSIYIVYRFNRIQTKKSKLKSKHALKYFIGWPPTICKTHTKYIGSNMIANICQTNILTLMSKTNIAVSVSQ